MTRKTIIIASVSLTLAVTALIMIRSYFHSVWFYYSREFHYQQQKQEALNDIKEADTMILEYRSKRNAIQSTDLNYLDLEKELQIDTESKGE